MSQSLYHWVCVYWLVFSPSGPPPPQFASQPVSYWLSCWHHWWTLALPHPPPVMTHAPCGCLQGNFARHRKIFTPVSISPGFLLGATVHVLLFFCHRSSYCYFNLLFLLIYKMNVQYVYTKCKMCRKNRNAHTAAPSIVCECVDLFLSTSVHNWTSVRAWAYRNKGEDGRETLTRKSRCSPFNRTMLNDVMVF